MRPVNRPLVLVVCVVLFLINHSTEKRSNGPFADTSDINFLLFLRSLKCTSVSPPPTSQGYPPSSSRRKNHNRKMVSLVSLFGAFDACFCRSNLVNRTSLRFSNYHAAAARKLFSDSFNFFRKAGNLHVLGYLSDKRSPYPYRLKQPVFTLN